MKISRKYILALLGTVSLGSYVKAKYIDPRETTNELYKAIKKENKDKNKKSHTCQVCNDNKEKLENIEEKLKDIMPRLKNIEEEQIKIRSRLSTAGL
jgi:tRNA U54 and U55 pseudouridine synthase Pus10